MLPEHAIPYGLRDVKIREIDQQGEVTGSAIDLPASQTFSFSEEEEFEELRGDDRVITARGSGATVEWELESGGISLEAYRAINGGTIVEEEDSGDPGTIISKTYSKKVTDQRPFFQVEGKAISDSGGDFHVLVYRCRATEGIEGEMADGEFWVSEASGQGFADESNDDKLYDFIQNAEEQDIT